MDETIAHETPMEAGAIRELPMNETVIQEIPMGETITHETPTDSNAGLSASLLNREESEHFARSGMRFRVSLWTIRALLSNRPMRWYLR